MCEKRCIIDRSCNSDFFMRLVPKSKLCKICRYTKIRTKAKTNDTYPKTFKGFELMYDGVDFMFSVGYP